MHASRHHDADNIVTELARFKFIYCPNILTYLLKSSQINSFIGVHSDSHVYKPVFFRRLKLKLSNENKLIFVMLTKTITKRR